jgi:hypothetical protein
MAAPKATVLLVFNLGAEGVNVDLNPFQLLDNQFRKTQNMISDPLGVQNGLSNRPGLIKFNLVAGVGPILGGIGVPLTNLKTGTKLFYIGRGEKS